MDAVVITRAVRGEACLRRFNFIAFCIAGMVACSLIPASGQSSHGTIVVPESSVVRPEDFGVRAHTNHLILVPFKGVQPLGTGPGGGMAPSDIRQAYSLGTTASGSGVIVIVDAYNYPYASNDLGVFSSQFGLPAMPACTSGSTGPCFVVQYASSKPRNNCSWAQEEALDIEWSHAMAPNARIVLMEAASNSFSNLFAAIDKATQYIQNNGGKGEISMSWGGSEFSGETADDSHFTPSCSSGSTPTCDIVYFASSGDTGGKTIYPSASPDVVAAGGTTLNLTFSGGTVTSISETGWSGSGGGPSSYEAIPSYQSAVSSVSSIVGSHRGIPDYSFDADPNTGVSVYDSYSCQGLSGWLVFGGTSVASPSLSGIVNSAATMHGSFNPTSNAELTEIYNNYNSANYPNYFRDILSGTAGSYSATTGWDFVTGVGSDLTYSGK
jgi:kumamolisin